MKKLFIAGILATLTTTVNAMSVEEVVSSKVMTYDVLSTTCKMLKKKSRYTKEEVVQLKAFATENKICGYEPEIKVISTKPVISQEPTPTKAELEDKVAMLEGRITKLEKIVETLTNAEGSKVEVKNIETTTEIDSCTQMAGIARLIMEKRQQGTPMSALLKLNTDNGWKSLDFLVMQAYEKPRYTTDSIVQRTITEFENETHLTCLKNK